MATGWRWGKSIGIEFGREKSEEWDAPDFLSVISQSMTRRFTYPFNALTLDWGHPACKLNILHRKSPVVRLYGIFVVSSLTRSIRRVIFCDDALYK